MGLLFVYDVQHLTPVFRQRISADPVFLACAAPSFGGAYVITRRGSILRVDVNHDTMVPFVAQSLKNVDLAIRLATQAELPGAEPLFQQKFEQVRPRRSLSAVQGLQCGLRHSHQWLGAAMSWTSTGLNHAEQCWHSAGCIQQQLIRRRQLA